jgi:hypothetical protein
VVGIALVALLPLYGDIRPEAAVSHPEWARMMLRGLDLLRDSPGINDTATQAFATLSGRQSRAWPAPQFVRAERVEGIDAEGAKRIRPRGGIGEAVYAFGVARGGDYRLRLHLAGPGAAETEFTEAGSDAILRSFSVPAVATMGWVDAGSLHLDPGAYEATVLLPEGSQLEFVELAPPCLHPIEPRGGWKNTAVASTEDVAVTVLQALDLEAELPPAAPPLEYRGGDLQLEDGSRTVAVSGEGGFRGGPRGSRVVLMVDIPETGLYSLSRKPAVILVFAAAFGAVLLCAASMYFQWHVHWWWAWIGPAFGQTAVALVLVRRNPKPDPYIAFISHRTAKDRDAALLIQKWLSERGYKTFIDVVDLRTGQFGEHLFRAIDDARFLILILSPNSLDRCVDEKDWIRQEIAHSLSLRKTIILVFKDSFRFDTETNIPGLQEIERLKQYQGVNYSNGDFEGFMRQLLRMLEEKPAPKNRQPK